MYWSRTRTTHSCRETWARAFQLLWLCGPHHLPSPDFKLLTCCVCVCEHGMINCLYTVFYFTLLFSLVMFTGLDWAGSTWSVKRPGVRKGNLSLVQSWICWRRTLENWELSAKLKDEGPPFRWKHVFLCFLTEQKWLQRLQAAEKKCCNREKN